MSQSKSALQQLQAQFSQEREHLAQQVQELALEHQHRECRLQEAQCCALQDMEDAQQIELRVRASYIQTQAAQMQTHTMTSACGVTLVQYFPNTCKVDACFINYGHFWLCGLFKNIFQKFFQ